MWGQQCSKRNGLPWKLPGRRVVRLEPGLGSWREGGNRTRQPSGNLKRCVVTNWLTQAEPVSTSVLTLTFMDDKTIEGQAGNGDKAFQRRWLKTTKWQTPFFPELVTIDIQRTQSSKHKLSWSTLGVVPDSPPSAVWQTRKWHLSQAFQTTNFIYYRRAPRATKHM